VSLSRETTDPALVPEVAPSTQFAFSLLGGLIRLGVQDIVVAPGARSQALALAAEQLARLGDVRLHVRIDERAAGFLGLGLSIETAAPTVVITTSGTAVANLHPAVLEAHHSGVPLLILTADRPEELRGIASNQTTHQTDIFGVASRWSIDESAPMPESDVDERGLTLAAQAYARATDAHYPGPVHLNLAFRDPLSSSVSAEQLEDLLGAASAKPDKTSPSSKSEDAPSPSGAQTLLQRGPRTIVIAGTGAGPAAEELAHQGSWPLLAEIASGARFGRNLIVGYRELLAQPDLVDEIQRVIVFGHPTLSREIPALIGDRDRGIETIVIRGTQAEVYNPGHNVARVLDRVTVAPGEADRAWLGVWLTASRAVVAEHEAALLEAHPETRAPVLTTARAETLASQRVFVKGELAAVRAEVTRDMLVAAVWRSSWPHDRLVLGASRLIRVADRWLPGKKISVHANRGLAGIDGTISTGVGIALASAPALTRVLLGDLATLHDAGSMLFGHGEERPRIQVIVGNDGGGSIFDLLEVAQSASVEAVDRVLFTPHEANFESLAAAYGWHYVRVTNAGELERALTGAGAGPELVEVILAR
jgi:2-succinyl-5-enolpyruvyl-6-hydroxy-3-cyclohexene-1-carboxylate synthase